MSKGRTDDTRITQVTCKAALLVPLSWCSGSPSTGCLCSAAPAELFFTNARTHTVTTYTPPVTTIPIQSPPGGTSPGLQARHPPAPPWRPWACPAAA